MSSLSFFQQVQPKAGTPGVEQPSGAPAGAPAQQAGGAQSMLPMLLPFAILIPFLYMSFRRQKKEQQARSSLKKGDKVVTQGGVIGELVEMDERIAKVKIAPGTTIQVLATGIGMFEVAAPASAKGKELDDLKEAKAAADKK